MRVATMNNHDQIGQSGLNSCAWSLAEAGGDAHAEGAATALIELTEPSSPWGDQRWAEAPIARLAPPRSTLAPVALDDEDMEDEDYLLDDDEEDDEGFEDEDEFDDDDLIDDDEDSDSLDGDDDLDDDDL